MLKGESVVQLIASAVYAINSISRLVDVMFRLPRPVVM